MGAALTMTAQQSQSPVVFRNGLEYFHYQLEHLDRIPYLHNMASRSMTSYSQKLDSVIGADNFDWTRWKNEYTYSTIALEDGTSCYDNRNRTEVHFVWDDQNWLPELKSEYVVDGTDEKVQFFRWNGEDWEDDSKVSYHYSMLDGDLLLCDVETEGWIDTLWGKVSLSVYEYDDQHRMIRNVFYRLQDEEGEWIPESKTECNYNAEGELVSRVSSTCRNGEWRERSIDSLSYNGEHRCTLLRSFSKGGFGPGANQWRLGSKYVFAYTDGQLESETYYSAGWFGTEMSLQNKTGYQYDVRGNLVGKTASIFNGVDWIVRDEYENRFESTVDASLVLGFTPLWSSTLESGMGYVLDPAIPVYNQWLSCNIVSSMIDTQFALYYSGFAAVNEYPSVALNAYGAQGRLVVESAAPADVVVYDLLGRVAASCSQVLRAEFSLKPGLYFVSNGSKVLKTMVR